MFHYITFVRLCHCFILLEFPHFAAAAGGGADGIQNELTPAEIADADIIIHAVAIAPQNNERFDSYDIYEIGLQDAIKNAKGIIQEIESMEG